MHTLMKLGVSETNVQDRAKCKHLGLYSEPALYVSLISQSTQTNGRSHGLGRKMF